MEDIKVPLVEQPLNQPEIGEFDDLIEEGASEEDIDEQMQPAPENNNVLRVNFAEMPLIRMEHDIKQNADEVIRHLSACHTIYKRDGRLVQLTTAAPEQDAEIKTAIPKIYDIQPAKLKAIISNVARFESYDMIQQRFVEKKPSPDIANAVYSDHEFVGVREIFGITTSPTMRADGSVLCERGYDPSTKMFYSPSREYSEIPEQPTREDAKNAYKFMCTPWVDFPVVSPSGRVVPIAAVLTAVCRHAVGGAVPAFAFDASTPGSGKTLQAQCVSILATGRSSAVTAWPNNDDREVEKLISSFVLAGAGIIVFDNVCGSAVFGGQSLDGKLTAEDTTSFRILGQSKTVEMPWRSTIIATGNNMQIGADTTRRTIICRLEPQVERPEERDVTAYAIPDLEMWCKKNHPKMVAAALTLVRAYHIAGRPKQPIKSWGSFQPWTDLIASALYWASGENVLEARAAVASEPDDESSALSTFMSQWRSYAPTGMGLRTAIDRLYTVEYMRGNTMPDGWDPLREAIELLCPPQRSGGKPEASRLGYVLRKFKGKMVKGLMLRSKQDRNGIATWSALGIGE